MKALSLIAGAFAAFLIILGLASRKTAGGLSYAVIIGGALVGAFVVVFRTINYFKEKNGK